MITAWLVACVSLLLSNCGRDPGQAGIAIPSRENVDVLTHDFGAVAVDRGPVRLEHTFRIANGTDRLMEIKDIKKSCGCIEAAATRQEVGPGESTSVTVALELSQSGPVAHGANIVCVDGRIIPMRIQATGTRELEFVPILLERTPSDSRVRMRFYLVGAVDTEDNDSLKVISPDGVQLNFDGWHAIERASDAPGRATRLVGSGSMDFSKFHGTLPVRVTMLAAGLVEQTVEIGEPLMPRCQ